MKKICLLYGGESTEKDVSISSSAKLREALSKLGTVIDLNPADGIPAMVKALDEFKPDCVFNGLYGGYGEDGEIHGILNSMKIPYTHSGVTASQLGMNKSLSAIIFEKYGIPTPKTKVIKPEEIKDLKGPYPFVIKPECGGSSVGVHIINSADDLKNIDWPFHDLVLVQEYIPGRELTVGVLNGKALAVTEIVPKSGFYDYETKYSDGMAMHILPAEIGESATEQIMKIAESVYKHLRCRGIARVDFRYDEDNNAPYVLEINTQPGLTEFSLFPEQAKYRGISFQKLVEMVVDQACCDY